MDTESKTTILDGKLHIFLRPNSSFWWCGFHHQGKYIRTSTKCERLPDAKAFAEDWYHGRKSEIKSGSFQPIKEKTFADAAAQFLTRYKRLVEGGKKSSSYLLGMEKVLNSQVLPFFGPKPLSQLGTVSWNQYKASLYERNSRISNATLHQHKNVINVVCREAVNLGWIPSKPTIQDDHSSRDQTLPRSWFELKEYKQLLRASRNHIKTLSKTRWADAAWELHDYIIFMVNTGLRVGEAANVRFCDVQIYTDLNAQDQKGVAKRYLLIQNIKGKRGTGECKSFFGAVEAFERIVARRNPKPSAAKCIEPLFLEHHRDQFNTLLELCNLKFTGGQPPARRDFISLRHTYICFRLINGASVYDVAANCRTSVEMIEKHYARRLRPRMSQSLNRSVSRLKGFGE